MEVFTMFSIDRYCVFTGDGSIHVTNGDGGNDDDFKYSRLFQQIPVFSEMVIRWKNELLQC